MLTEEMRIWRERKNWSWKIDPNNFGKAWPGFVEILKLEELLIAADIPYEKRHKLDGWIIIYKDGDNIIGDAVEHGGSYGNQSDLLEVYKFGIKDEEGHDEVEGWLTAEEAFEYFRKAYERSNNK